MAYLLNLNSLRGVPDAPLREPLPIKAAGRCALVFGPTGATGRFVVRKLLQSPAWSKVTVVTRTKFNPKMLKFFVPKNSRDRLEIHYWDDFEGILNDAKSDTVFNSVDSVFLCIGVRDDPFGPEIIKVEVDLTRLIVEKAVRANVPHFCCFTVRGGGDIDSSNHYKKAKATKEKLVSEAGFRSVTILRPWIMDRMVVSRSLFVLIGACVFKEAIKVATMADLMVLDAERVDLEEEFVDIDKSKKDQKVMYEGNDFMKAQAKAYKNKA